MRGIIFDLDDTLYAREIYLQSGFEAVASHVADSWRRSREPVLATLRRAHISGHEGEEFQVLCNEHRLPLSVVPMLVQSFRRHRPAITLQPAVRTMLQKLRCDAWRIAILTNGDPEVQQRKIEALGLGPLVDCVVFAEEHTRHGKPDRAAFLVAVQRLRLHPAQCLNVGDDPLCDVVGAHAAGLKAIRVLSPPDTNGLPPDAQWGWPTSEAEATTDTVLDAAAIAPLVMESPRVS
jgi:putative hydrolase of the HAD superfamily